MGYQWGPSYVPKLQFGEKVAEYSVPFVGHFKVEVMASPRDLNVFAVGGIAHPLHLISSS